MNAKSLLSAILPVFLTVAASGQRTLTSDEIRQVFQKVTSEPRRTWLPAGTIEATHQEYVAAKTADSAQISQEIDRQLQEYQSSSDKRELTEDGQKMKLDAIPFNVRYRLGNEYTMTSHVTVKYDGDRFLWAINVDSRQDSVVPDATLAGNWMTDQFDLGFNRSRAFAWDGDKYTTYTASGNLAMVDAAGRLPHAVHGPLTAGVIPWGYGRFTYSDLMAATTVATETSASGQTQIQMTLTRANGSVTKLALDPAKKYAVIAATVPLPNDAVVNCLYTGYRQVGAYWIPSSISIERHEAGTNELLRSEQWTFTSVSAAVPTSDSFTINYPSGTLVEYTSPVSDSPLMYQSYSADTDRLLAERLTYAASPDKAERNCATIALQHAASRLGRRVSDSSLAGLVGPNKQTSLYAMKQFAQGLGLYCRAVKTDLATLAELEGVQVILHIPARNHFVVLDGVDDRSVRLIDLSSNKFYYPQSVHFFPDDWSQGTALLLSDKPISGHFTDLADSALTTFLGGYWTCTKLYQQEDWVYCDYYCGGSWFELYWERYTCESAPAGSCQGVVFVRWQESPCDWDEFLVCAVTGDWIFHYMRGCYP
ncbi:MAG: hypothetical protein JW955_23230 [Sedimentisphaerales bacterium]|nr:hypothetical protein [Sedimentisphaerales bacterium]